MLFFEHPLLESARFDRCRNRFCTHLYSAVRSDAPREPPGTVSTTFGAGLARWRIVWCLETPLGCSGVLKHPPGHLIILLDFFQKASRMDSDDPNSDGSSDAGASYRVVTFYTFMY